MAERVPITERATAAMHFLSLPLQRAGAMNLAINGSFSAPKKQELVVARGTSLELLRPDEAGKLQSVVVQQTFSVIRTLKPFACTGRARTTSWWAVTAAS